MDKGALLVSIMAAGGAAFYWITRAIKGAPDSPPAVTPASYQAPRPLPTWTPPAKAAPYLTAFSDAERINGLPRNLLARMAQRESNYNPAARGASGEVGIMQIIPRWHPTVNASDPYASIAYAGRWLRQLYNQFGTWEHAIAAYNWGPTALHNYGLDAAPASTKNYIAAIAADVRLT